MSGPHTALLFLEDLAKNRGPDISTISGPDYPAWPTFSDFF
jgi:hypothetical protein